VLGIGFAATRDINAFFRNGSRDDAGFANPVAGKIKAAIAIGGSQSGNFLRTFTHLGFNQAEKGQDESKRMVGWDRIPDRWPPAGDEYPLCRAGRGGGGERTGERGGAVVGRI